MNGPTAIRTNTKHPVSIASDFDAVVRYLKELQSEMVLY